jgi:hypothetical protein
LLFLAETRSALRNIGKENKSGQILKSCQVPQSTLKTPRVPSWTASDIIIGELLRSPVSGMSRVVKEHPSNIRQLQPYDTNDLCHRMNELLISTGNRYPCRWLPYHHRSLALHLKQIIAIQSVA